MTDNEFFQHIDDTFLAIEDAIELCELDIDCESSGGMLKLTFPNKIQVVLNKQTPLHQLWLAGKKQGYHFDFVNEKWICNRSGQEFTAIFNQVCSESAAQPLMLL